MRYTIALSLISAISQNQALELLRHVEDAEAILMRPEESLAQMSANARVPIVKAIKAERDGALKRAEDELAFCQKHSIQVIPYLSEAYPYRLKNCPDSPLVLFYCGNADLNAKHILAIVGTRHITEYGKLMCSKLLKELHILLPDTLIISGLAYGVDIHAQRAWMGLGHPTVGVVAHGLDQIYPAAHRNDAAKMSQHGGILTEYVRQTRPLQGNFLRRNRIIAGLSDATLVIESAKHGGSLVTARLANEYDRMVLAVPGRATDPYSEGCNNFISTQRAQLVTTGEDIVKELGWWEDSLPFRSQHYQLELGFANEPIGEGILGEAQQLSLPQQQIVRALQGTDGLTTAQIAEATQLSTAEVTSLLFEMEMDGNVKALPGSRYYLTL